MMKDISFFKNGKMSPRSLREEIKILIKLDKTSLILWMKSTERKKYMRKEKIN